MSDNICREGDTRARMGDLLDRYPHLHADERSDLLRFLTHGALVDRGMIRGDATLGPIVERVESDHPDHFRASLSSSLLVAVLLTVPLLMMCWLAMYYSAK